MRNFVRFAVLVLFTAVLQPIASAQTPFASGLQLPSKIIFTPRGHLLVAENGSGPNAGRISIVDRLTGLRRTLISGLPAGINSAEGTPAPSGPAGVVLSGNTLYILIAEGDSVLAGPVPGTQVANPSPASPILSSLIAVTLAGPIDDMPDSVALTPADHSALKSGQTVVAGSGSNQMTFKLVADFANYTSEPRGDLQANVRHSDPYGLAILGGNAFVADAGQNSIRKVNLSSGEITTLTTFPPIPNTTGIGGPFIEAVPDSIRADGNRLLVTLLTGFPFAPNLAKAYAIDPVTGAATTIVSGLTSAIDVAPVTTDTAKLYVVAEHSSNLLASAPGRILIVPEGKTPADATLSIPNVASPSSIAVDPHTSEIFVAQIFPGTIVALAANFPTSPQSLIPVIASVPGILGSRFETSLQMSNPHPYSLAGIINIRAAGGVKSLPYQLAPFETKTYANVMTTVDATGAATADVLAAVGPAPVLVARIFDTSRSSAATGVVIPQVSPEAALHTGDRAALVTASDPFGSRTNIGIRPLGVDTRLRLSLYRSSGVLVTTVDKLFAANTLFQQSTPFFFNVAPGPSDLITIEVVSGAAIVYNAIVNDTTQETSFALATPVSN
ncbi:MAG: hypothetical protein QOC81_4421 [Thermoanaerobaculia bacterium]|jgi:hypothetical protein|nr:hypothetical protein [Thermoanaerobaculia bacterium]